MNVFAQKKILIITIIALTIINLSSIIFFIYTDNIKHHRGNDRRDSENLINILKEKLSLTEKQIKLMTDLRSDFYSKEKQLSETIRNERDSMNQMMFNKVTNEDRLRLLARKVADNEYQMEILRIEQAKSMKAICNSDQLAKLEDLVKEIRDYFKPNHQEQKK